MLRVLLVLSLVLATVRATTVKQCKDKPFPLSVNIQDCDEPPCIVYKGTVAVMEVHFLGNNNNIKSITATTTAKVLGMNLPYDLPEEVSDVCRNLLYGAMCPIDKDEDVTYQFNFYVEPAFPEITADVTVTLNDEDGEPITCFMVSCKLRKGATATQRDEYLLDWTNPHSE
ncbi:mite group 2 allergen Gly d 2.02 [Drosophila kikkawai]|uniref:Mite group 2 allergen Gly d 2.02 n=1 Tax=Drosophila kikkawai TaxID=30033 RepID=A0A6P4J4S3_DROKI|nr:mite group 2 allergen Gly d 2.02 [Drosophila kikkawai]